MTTPAPAIARTHARTTIGWLADELLGDQPCAGVRSERTRLLDTQSPDGAAGMCITTTLLVSSVLHAASIPHTLVEALWGDGDGPWSHTALLMTDTAGQYVIDYTARQFDDTLPWPLVCSVPEWLTAIGAANPTISTRLPTTPADVEEGVTR